MNGSYSLSLPLPIMPGTSVPGMAQIENSNLVNDLSESSGSKTVSGNKSTYSETDYSNEISRQLIDSDSESDQTEFETVSGNNCAYLKTDLENEFPEQFLYTVSESDQTELDTSQLVQLVTEQNIILQNGFTAISIMLGLIFGAIAIKGFWIARVKE